VPVGQHRRRRFDGRDLDPHTSGPGDAPFHAWRQRLAALPRFAMGSELAGEIETVEVVQPDGTDAYIVRSTEDPDVTFSVPTNGDYQFTPGERATVANTRAGSLIIGSPVAGERSKSQKGTARLSGQLDELALLSASPDTIAAGGTESVTFTGVGFSSSPVDTFTPVVKDETTPPDEWTEDVDVTISSVAYVSASSVTANVTVAASKAAGYQISVRVTRS